jgi:hypothetical protein
MASSGRVGHFVVLGIVCAAVVLGTAHSFVVRETLFLLLCFLLFFSLLLGILIASVCLYAASTWALERINLHFNFTLSTRVLNESRGSGE